MNRAMPISDAVPDVVALVTPDAAPASVLATAAPGGSAPDALAAVRRYLSTTPHRMLAVGVAGVAILAVLTLIDAGGQVVLWENAHWTLAGVVATAYVAAAARRATGLERRLRVLVALGMGSWLVGQLAWDVQTAVGWFSVPAPSDAGFLLAMPPIMVALVLLVRGRLARAEEIAVYLDAATIFMAITATILAAYGGRLTTSDPLEAAIVVAYPIVHLGTAAAGVAGLLAVRAIPRLGGGYLLLASVAALGVAWVEWLRQAVVALPQPGSIVNVLFSLAIIGIGIGGANWRVTEAAGDGTRRAATVVIGGLPILALTLSAGVLLTHRLEGQEFGLVDATALAVMLLAGIRQTLLVHERGRLLNDSRGAREELEAALIQRAEADSRYRGLVEHVPAAVYIDVEDEVVTDGGRLAYMSPRIEDMLGYPSEAFIDDPELWPGLIHPDDRARAVAAYLEHWRTGDPLRAEYRMMAQDGTVIWVRDEAFVMTDVPTGARRVSQGLLVDTTDQKRLEAQLLHDALHDPLTGLANRVLFRDHVERALGRRRRGKTAVALLFLDLDDFKVVNDSLGHKAGDRLLVEVAARLSEATRAGDIAARPGGDEFTVLLEGVHGVDDATAAAARLACDLSRPIELEGRSVVVGVSVGIALADGPDTAADDLLAHADAAMYAAKAQGKGRHAVFDPSMRVRARSRLETEAELRAAIEQEAFELHYQPIVELATGRIEGFEALVRWRHPERGLVHPAEFIPLAEATGLIVPLGRLVATEACRQLRAWRDGGSGREHLTMSVNVSVRQAIEPDFAREVREILEETGVESSSLVMEITESLTLYRSATGDSSLRSLSDLGVRLVIDDFGTGFSALEYFKRFSVQGLKIDRSFIEGLGRTREDTAIVTATLAFAAALGLSVTAEGVETDEQVMHLRHLGCDGAQGFLFGPPVPADEVTAMLSSQPHQHARPSVPASGSSPIAHGA